MAGKRKKSDDGDEDGSKSSRKSFVVDGDDDNKQKKNGSKGQQVLPSTIKNKEKRSAVHAKLKQQKKLEKRKRAKTRDAAEKQALELGEEVYISGPLYFASNFYAELKSRALIVWLSCLCSRRRR